MNEEKGNMHIDFVEALSKEDVVTTLCEKLGITKEEFYEQYEVGDIVELSPTDQRKEDI